MKGTIMEEYSPEEQLIALATLGVVAVVAVVQSVKIHRKEAKKRKLIRFLGEVYQDKIRYATTTAELNQLNKEFKEKLAAIRTD
jgi:hypothetical protein